MADENWGLQSLQPERVPVEENDPHRGDHELLFAFQSSLILQQSQGEFADNFIFQEMNKLPPAHRVELIEIALARIAYTRARRLDYRIAEDLQAHQGTFPLVALIKVWMDEPMLLKAAQMERLMDLSLQKSGDIYSHPLPIARLLPQLRQFADDAELLQQWQPRFRQLRQALSPSFITNLGPQDSPYIGNAAMCFFRDLLGQQSPDFLERGDNWAETALDDLAAMDETMRAHWRSLFEQAHQSGSSKPSTKWLKAAAILLQALGKAEFVQRVQKWFPLYGTDDGWWFADREESNDAWLKGLIWTCALVENADIVSALGAALRGAFKKRGRAGVRSQKVGNACIWVLGQRDESEAASHLVVAKNRVKNGSVVKTLQRAIETVAERAGMTPEDLEELAVPDFGLQNGLINEDFEGAKARIELVGNKAVWRWENEGKSVKAVPASVKRDFAAEWKDLKVQVAEMEKVFAAQKDRLDALLRSEKTWDYATWKLRYLDHTLMQVLAGRLIWNFTHEGQTIAAVPTENGFVNANHETVAIDCNAQVALYHPLNDATENVLAWRRFFEEGAIKQPFKQAHREIYVLTDAERATATYSNRFAGHVLKQHQFNSLCAARGWKNQLRLMVDDQYHPASKVWPRHDLRAEFWIEGIGQDYGTDTNEAGTYLRLSTDQVRFYRIDATQNWAHASGGGYNSGYRQAPATALELTEIPPLIWSETMRDVDLFVGVSSVGADPNWSDGGPQGHFRDYWQHYSWGELGESAKTRADVLSRLLPRLKIRDVAQLAGRFLRVQGKLRTYKIHLGSGNILMEPNDQYLCIVGGRDENAELFLPFEGDRTLAVILSKAFLLRDDDKIKDTSIMRQIRA